MEEDQPIIRNPALVNKFEHSEMRSAPPNYLENLKIVEAFYQEACLLGAFPLKDPLEGIEVDIRLAKVLNALKSA